MAVDLRPKGRGAAAPSPAGSRGSSRHGSLTSSPLVLNASGAADEDMFMRSFEDVPRIEIYSSKDVCQELSEITKTLSDAGKDWEKRAESVRRIRSLVISGATEYDDFYKSLKQLELACQLSLKDLRSKVVRETCITVAFLSQTLGIRVDRFCEGVLPTLFNLIPNSTKIMSTSAIVCIRFVIQYTHAPRMIPIICYNMSSRDKSIRKAVCEFLDHLLHTWPTHSLEKHMGILQEAIKKGISDADPEARAYSRKAFWGFADHFKDQAECMIHTLDSTKQKMLYGEMSGSLSASNSSNSLNSCQTHVSNGRPSISNHQSISFRHGPPYQSSFQSSASRAKTVSGSSSVQNLSRPWSAMSGRHNMRQPNKSRIPVFSPNTNGDPNYALDRMMPSPIRYASAIDVGAARRARARAVIAASTVYAPHSSSFSRPSIARRYVENSPTVASGVVTTPSETRGRTNGRVSQSQPSSRSASPSSILNYYNSDQRSFRRTSGIPQSTSRDPSPARSHMSNVTVERGRRVSDVVDRSTDPNNTAALYFEAATRHINNLNISSKRRSSESSDGGGSRTEPQLIRGVDINNLSSPQNLNKSSDNSSNHLNDHLKENNHLNHLNNHHNNHHHKSSEDASSTGSSGDHCIDFLRPILGELPTNTTAIKMITKMVEQQPRDVVMDLLPDMMPALVLAYDSPEIAVRKAAVFAMVAVHNSVGEEPLKIYLEKLNGSKMKLLNLYVERSKAAQNQHSSGCSSPSQASQSSQ